MSWDVFISHASEDEAAVAKPLADMLQAEGLKVWYAEYTLSLGDNLRRSIEQGLADSRYGIVVLSPSFFAKKWTQLELDGLFALERIGQKKILPVWHNVTAADVEQFSSFMAMRLGVPTTAGLDQVVAKIIQAISRDTEASIVEDEPTSSPRLHPHSTALLQAAVNSDGRIIANWHLGGLSVRVGRSAFGNDGDPRAIALNLHCLDELLMNGLLEKKSESLFVLTQEGYDYQLPPGVVDAPQPQFPSLTPANQQTATEIMLGAVAGSGRINSYGHLAGHVLSAGAVRWESSGDRRMEARWESVLRELVSKGLLLQRTPQAYLVTHLGFLWTDTENAAMASKPST
jgi:hypothetical protein